MKWSRVFSITLVLGIAGTAVTIALAAPGTDVAFRVNNEFGVGETLETPLPFCPGTATVTTLEENVRFAPPLQSPAWFTGLKEFRCGDSGAFTISFMVKAFFCSPIDEGHWKVVSASGTYAGLKGQGKLVGTFYGDICEPDGVTDGYFGDMKLG